MEKAIEIKRRAQRCILNGDLNGALAEYEKLVAIGDPDPYYCVLLADLLYKMGSASDAQKRYLEAIQGYAKSGLYKNGIAVCKKMSRLSLAPIEVARSLAQLYSLDGLSTEASLAYQQLAEVLVKSQRIDEARSALKQAIEVTPDSGRLHERLAEVELLTGDKEAAGNALSDAAEYYERAGQQADAKRCRNHIAQLRLPTPPRGTAIAAEEEAVAEEEPSAPVLTWEAPQPGELESKPLSISHAPPMEDSEDEAEPSSAKEPSTPVAVVHGFGKLEAKDVADDDDEVTLEEPALEDDEEEVELVEDEDEVEADEEVQIGAVAAEEEAEGEQEEEEETRPNSKPRKAATPVATSRKSKPPTAEPPREAPKPAAPSLSLAGFDPNEYGIDDATETNGPVSTPVDATDDIDSIEHDAPPAKRPQGPGAPPQRLGRAMPPAVTPTGPPALRKPPAAPVPVASAATPPPAPPAAGKRPPARSAVPGDGAPHRTGGRRIEDDATPARPGLGAHAAADARASGAAAEPQEDTGLANVSLILAEAQTCFLSGDRDGATMALIRAAQAYDQIGRFDSAVAIYRSLGQSPDVSLQLMMLWLKNCQRRNDRAEAARVACDLGDRALNDGDVAGAREWFERASLYDPENELAKRRLRTLDGAAADAPATGASQPTAVTTDAGHLHVRTEHDEPVVVDLGELIDEFQRAIGPELASDPQGHYDLGVSYREMGLTEQAVQSLRIAAKAPAFRLRAGELAGRCLLDLGHFDEAAEVLRETLGAPDLVPSAAVDLRYQLALALEAAGHSVEALAEFERVYAAQANYPDVAMKIRLLRKTAGAA